MDPYIERRWRNFHTSMVIYARDRLNELLPAELAAYSEDRVYVEADGERMRAIYPDVRVSERVKVPLGASPNLSDAAIAQPVLIDMETEPVTEHFLKIIEVDGERVVTGIEMISPANKQPGPGRDEYLLKRQEFFDSNANLVEIDLVRTGDWRSIMIPYRVPSIYQTLYRVCVRRVNRPGKAELYPITLQQQLPTIAIPLREQDQDVQLNLQELMDDAYQRGRYDGIDYHQESIPPLKGDDALWADQLLRQSGRR
jgi:hypothetical protein